MPKKGFDENKIKKIKEVLKDNPKGIWIRELARKTKLPKTTVSRYINIILKKDIENIFTGGNGFVKIIRLKKNVR